jgi:hypothetical protein
MPSAVTNLASHAVPFFSKIHKSTLARINFFTTGNPVVQQRRVHWIPEKWQDVLFKLLDEHGAVKRI